jgi:hypothetical protein
VGYQSREEQQQLTATTSGWRSKGPHALTHAWLGMARAGEQATDELAARTGSAAMQGSSGSERATTQAGRDMHGNGNERTPRHLWGLFGPTGPPRNSAYPPNGCDANSEAHGLTRGRRGVLEQVGLYKFCILA